MLEHLNVFLIVRHPRLNTGFEVWSQQCKVWGYDYCPGPAGLIQIYPINLEGAEKVDPSEEGTFCATESCTIALFNLVHNRSSLFGNVYCKLHLVLKTPLSFFLSTHHHHHHHHHQSLSVSGARSGWERFVTHRGEEATGNEQFSALHAQIQA